MGERKKKETFVVSGWSEVYRKVKVSALGCVCGGCKTRAPFRLRVTWLY